MVGGWLKQSLEKERPIKDEMARETPQAAL
jgi:hypothetical protein